MGKSKSSFTKKEKEKKRLIKKKEKEERKEIRKSNSTKGQSFEDMLAYVDENGNITSTPPDTSKKKQISLESIQISVTKQEDIPIDTVRIGTVTFFNESKGYGFIKDQASQESIFVHNTGLVDSIRERDKVTFEVEMTSKGKNAVDVKIVKK